MATIIQEILLPAASPETVWDALRDVGALHTRLVPGFVTHVELVEGARLVTFGDGTVVRELIITVDDATRRVAWSVVGTAMTHHNASAQVFPEGRGARFVWVADLLPDAAAPRVAGMIAKGLEAVQRTFASGNPPVR